MIYYKGFDKNLKCHGFQYQVGETYKEENADLCYVGFHACEVPHDVFKHYSAGDGNKFHKVELEEISEQRDSDDSKVCAKKIKIGPEISVFQLVKISVKIFFEKFEFNKKINQAKEEKEKNAGNRGAANAGNRGAANAGNFGAANAGDCGAANAGDFGAANAGNRGAANAGNRGAANAGNCGAANAGDCGAANAGDCGAANAGNRGAANAGNRGAANAGDFGAAIVRHEGSASVKKEGVAIAFGKNAKARGDIGSVLVLCEYSDDFELINCKSRIVDGKKIKANIFYTLKNGKIIEAPDTATEVTC